MHTGMVVTALVLQFRGFKLGLQGSTKGGLWKCLQKKYKKFKKK